MELPLAVLSGLLGATGFAILIRYGGPFLNRIFAGFFAVQRQLESDRTRIVAQLREEIADLNRRIDALEEDNTRLLADNERLRAKLREQDRFIDELLRRSGIKREDVR